MNHVSDIDALGHNWNAGVVVEEVTCQSIGSKKFTCTRCGAEKLETTAKLNHTVQTVTTPATCTEKGKEETKCSVCGEVIHSTNLAAKGHTWNAGEVKVAATCSSIGSKEYTCTACNETKLETIAKLEHVASEEKTENATCTEAGRTYTECTLCGELIVSTTIMPTGHTWGFKERTLEPTCENEGTEVYKCSVCSAEETRSVAKRGHSFTGKVETIPATCITEGSKFGHCIRCNQTTYESIAKIDHTENAGVVTTAPTCTATGIKTYSCSACGTALRTDVVAAMGHDLQESSKTAATCYSYEVINYKCSRCTYTTTETGTTYNSSNHAGGMIWTVTTEAKYFTKGTETEYCESCTGATGQTRDTASYKDLTGFWEGTDANGFITYSFADGKVVIGQTSADDVYSESEAYSYSVSNGKLTITIGESDKELTCTSETSSTITLSDAGVEFTLTRKTTAAHTHTYNSWTASGNVNANNEFITVYHYRLTNCTEHSTLSFHGDHDYGESHFPGDGGTCTVCDGPEYFKVQNDADNGSFYYVAGGGSITLPALPSGYDVWTINIFDITNFQTVEVEKAAGVSYSPTAEENCSLMSIGYPTGGIGGDVLFTTDPSAGGASYIFCAKRKCSKCSLAYTEDYCPTCTPKVGDIKEYGTYPADYAIESLKGKAIEWKVISVDAANSRVLVMSVNALEKKVFSSNTIYYNNSSLRTYLNNTASVGFIGKYNLGGISMCGVSISNTTTGDAISFSATGDKVFLLSPTEVTDYLESSLRKANYNGSNVAWWTRTKVPGASVGHIYTISSGGTSDVALHNTEQYIRPVFWVNY
jgi:hypothetical protein